MAFADLQWGGGGPGPKCDMRSWDIPEPQNGCPAITARCSDHIWTSHNNACPAQITDIGLWPAQVLLPPDKSSQHYDTFEVAGPYLNLYEVPQQKRLATRYL